MASEKITAIIDSVKELSVLELKELIDAYCEEFGVSAVAAAAPAAAGAAAAAEEEKTRSMTGGRGDYSYEFARYEQTPSDVQEKEVAARAAKVAENNADD